MALRLAPNVSLAKATPQIVIALMVAVPVLEYYHSDLYVTSFDDGKHGEGTLHGKGRAFDFRIWYVEAVLREAMIARLAQRLGPEFDVILEPDHGHVEWDPDYLKPGATAEKV